MATLPFRSLIFAFVAASAAAAQSLGGAGMIRGLVTDPSSAPAPAAAVELSNPITGFSRLTVTDSSGRFVLSNVPANRYRLRITLAGFQPYRDQIPIPPAAPLDP